MSEAVRISATPGVVAMGLQDTVCVRCGAPAFPNPPGIRSSTRPKLRPHPRPDSRHDQLAAYRTPSAEHLEPLCMACRQRARRAAYFRRYYESHKERILAKNRRWARDNRGRLARERQARRVTSLEGDAGPRHCVDCGKPLLRALRCRRCHNRHRYGTDPTYRARRLTSARLWLARRRDGAGHHVGGSRATMATTVATATSTAGGAEDR